MLADRLSQIDLSRVVDQCRPNLTHLFKSQSVLWEVGLQET